MTATERPPWWAYAWWVAVGALVGLGVVSLLTIGIVIVPVGLLLGVVGALVPAMRNHAVGAMIAGAAAPAAYLAWLNRDGPGDHCTVHGDGQSCTELWNPWPFVAVAVLLVVVAVVVVRSVGADRPGPPSA